MAHSRGRRRVIRALAWTVALASGRVRRAAAAVAKPGEPDSRLRFFSQSEAARLDGLGNELVPGARAAGLSRFIDRYVTVAPANSLLMVRYLDVAPPYGDFYREGLRRVESYADAGEAVRKLAEADPLFHFVLRSDAIDVTYGTMSGFAELGVPYLPHIAPRVPW